MSLDRDVAVLVVFILTTIVGFVWRRTRIVLLYWLWLGMIWVEVQVRKWRDRKGGPRSL
jgi:hypothetical protein